MKNTNPKRIALVTDKFNLGGGLKHIMQITKGMPNIEFGIFAEDGCDSDSFSHIENVKIFNKGYRINYIYKFKPSIVHFHHLKPFFKDYFDPRNKNDIPILFTVHGMHIHKFRFSGGIKNKIKYQLRFNLEKFLFNRAHEIITVSREDNDFIKKYYHRNKCHYIPNGISVNGIEKISKCKTELRQNLKLPIKSKLFLTVARFNFQKGYDVLVKAISLIKEDIKNWDIHYIFVGDGEEKKKIVQLAKKLNVEKCITFLGRRDDIYKLMKACDYFISSSRWEGLPITLIEAAFCRLPIFASNTIGNREIILNNKNGILFDNIDSNDLAQKISALMNGQYNMQQRTCNAFEYVNQFCNNHQMVNKLNDIYNRYLEKS
jgi:glycosyltransferase involved in cell wall biosynthesis